MLLFPGPLPTPPPFHGTLPLLLFLQSDIGYTGISFCWPDPQGPEQGYNAMNAIVNNDVSRFMNYFESGDGGGIHIIGAVNNASHVSGNWFHGRRPRYSASFQVLGKRAETSSYVLMSCTLSDVRPCGGHARGPWPDGAVRAVL
jgi:hypothetical protein